MRKQRHWAELALLTSAIAVGASWCLNSQMHTGSFEAREHAKSVATNPPSPTSDKDISQSFRSGEYQRCYDLSDERLKVDPQDVVALRYQGMSLVELGLTAPALGAFTSGIELAKGSNEERGLLLMQRGRLYLKCHQIPEAIDDLQSAESLIECNFALESQLFDLLGQARAANGEPEKARLFFQSACQGISNPKATRHLYILEGASPSPDVTCDDWCPLCHPDAEQQGKHVSLRN